MVRPNPPNRTVGRAWYRQYTLYYERLTQTLVLKLWKFIYDMDKPISSTFIYVLKYQAFREIFGIQTRLYALNRHTSEKYRIWNSKINAMFINIYKCMLLSSIAKYLNHLHAMHCTALLRSWWTTHLVKVQLWSFLNVYTYVFQAGTYMCHTEHLQLHQEMMWFFLFGNKSLEMPVFDMLLLWTF